MPNTKIEAGQTWVQRESATPRRIARVAFGYITFDDGERTTRALLLRDFRPAESA